MGLYSKEFKNKAMTLRREGKTYSEVQRLLKTDFPKSTLRSWFKEIVLSPEQQERIRRVILESSKKGRKKALQINREKKEKLLQDISLNITNILDKIKDRDILRMLLSLLYLGEGSKWKSHRGLMLGSSDPTIINLYIRLLNLCYGLKTVKLKCRLSYRADQNLNALEKYWSKITGIPRKNFYKTIPDPRTIGKPTMNKKYKGVCVVSGGSTSIQLELEMIPEMILKGL